MHSGLYGLTSWHVLYVEQRCKDRDDSQNGGRIPFSGKIFGLGSACITAGRSVTARRGLD